MTSSKMLQVALSIIGSLLIVIGTIISAQLSELKSDVKTLLSITNTHNEQLKTMKEDIEALERFKDQLLTKQYGKREDGPELPPRN